jgi:L-alanine-DL-glutamate epimerase-like enolase superfamily enzyme
MRKAAALCEAFGMDWEPHSYGGAHYQAATLHVVLATKNCSFFELPIEQGLEGHFDVGTTETIRLAEDGCVHAPTAPGLGLEVDWDQVSAGYEIEL